MSRGKTPFPFPRLLFLSFLLGASSALSPDGLSLLAFKSAVDPQTLSATFDSWNESDHDPCLWTGVSCMNVSGSDDPRVVGITVAGEGVRAYLPSELGSLLFLRRLNLHGNRIYGSIPDVLANATSLHSIFLYGNNLSGGLPSSLCALPRLQNLDLSGNSLSGPLPTSLRDCRQLQRLSLAQNNFSGQIPGDIWPELGNLVQLDLSSNDLSGPIPPGLGRLKSLSGTLNLSYNHLSGKIPSSLGDLPVTVSFDLRHNNLSGEIPGKGIFSNQGPTAFQDNAALCGFPLRKPCKNPSSKSPSADHNRRESNSKSSSGGLKSTTIILISAADAGVVTLLGLIVVYVYWKRKDSSKGCSCTGRGKLGGESGRPCACLGAFGLPGSSSEGESEMGGEGGEGDLVAIDKGFNFELDELLRASAYVLGKSGLGIVYKVVLGNGVPVAVRRLGEGGGQRYKEFVAEIQAIGRVRHPNLVRLRAYYWAPDEKLLISDFISNGNLGNALRGRSSEPAASLTWPVRLRIAKGTARGLCHLHECSPRRYVHGDVKPSNILLDADFNPYISDFGLSRLVTIAAAGDPYSSSSFSQSYSSTGFIGAALPYSKPASAPPEKSHGYYRAPEARNAGGGGSRPTQKWDVYSFGVLLLEMLTGKQPEFLPSSPSPSPSSGAEATPQVPELVRWVRKGFEEECPLSELVDTALLQEVHAKKEVIAVFHIALACTEMDPELRPRMKTVLENLERIGKP